MNRVVLAAIVCAMTSAAAPMTKEERQRLLAHFEMTEKWLVSEVAGLSAQQEQFRPPATVWNVRDVIEHLAIAEPDYWKMVSESTAVALEAGFRSDITDAEALWYGIDRTERQKTSEARTPKGKYPSMAEALSAWRKLRSEIVRYVKTTDDDLRGHRLQRGKMDVYQWLLVISTHSQRHILQIQEIKAHQGFPAK